MDEKEGKGKIVKNRGVLRNWGKLTPQCVTETLRQEGEKKGENTTMHIPCSQEKKGEGGGYQRNARGKACARGERPEGGKRRKRRIQDILIEYILVVNKRKGGETRGPNRSVFCLGSTRKGRLAKKNVAGVLKTRMPGLCRAAEETQETRPSGSAGGE